MKRSNLLKAIIFTIFTLVLLAACSTDNDVENDPSNNNNNNNSNVSEEKESGGELIVGMTADPDTLNPLVSYTTTGNWIISAIYLLLIILNNNFIKIHY